MNPKELAARLNNRQYGDEITKEEEKLARENNLVVVFGYSDDIAEFRGAIHEEKYTGDETPIPLNKKGLVQIDEDDEEVLEKYGVLDQIKKGRLITAIFGVENYTWIYKTDIPHETFDILEDGEKYCRGIIFSLDSI